MLKIVEFKCGTAYQEKLPKIAPLLEAAKNNELNDSNLV